MIRLPRRITEKVRPYKWLRILPNFLRIPANFLRSLRSVCRISCESFANVKNTYECLTITTNALPSIRISCDAYENVTKTIRICFPSECYEHVPNIRYTTWNTTNAYEHLRMSGDHFAIIANWWRIAFVSTFAIYSPLCETAWYSQHHMNDRECLQTPRNVWRSLCDHSELMANCIRKPIRHSVRPLTQPCIWVVSSHTGRASRCGAKYCP